MKQLNRYYAVTDVADNLVMDYHKLQAIDAELRPFASDAFGFDVVLMLSPEDFIEHGIDRELFMNYTGGKFPFIFVGIAYVAEQFDITQLAPIEKKFGLALLAETVSKS